MDLSQLPEVQIAFEKAKAVWPHAYAKYSKYHVTAALKVKGRDELILGVNVENASFGATICAERTAFVSARAQMGDFEPEFIVVLTADGAGPCGLCLQVLSEFAGPDFPIYLGTPDGLTEKLEFRQLLKKPFHRFQA